MTNTVYKWVLCPLLMIQVKNGRWFLMLNSPTSIYYKKMDASSSTEQPRANSLQTSRVPNVGIFHHRMLHHRVQPSFWSWPSFLLSSFSFFPHCLFSPFLFAFFVFKISCVPTQEEYTKEIEAKIYSQVELTINLKRLKTWNIKRCMCEADQPMYLKVERIHSKWSVWGGVCQGSFLKLICLLSFLLTPKQVMSGSSHLISYAFCSLSASSAYLHFGGFIIQAEWYIAFLSCSSLFI